jgi:hypothetical protein
LKRIGDTNKFKEVGDVAVLRELKQEGSYVISPDGTSKFLEVKDYAP